MTGKTTQTMAKDASPAEAREIRYLAEHTDLSPNQAQELVKRYGTDRKKLMEEAKTIKAEG
jgi:hypothetical protein